MSPSSWPSRETHLGHSSLGAGRSEAHTQDTESVFLSRLLRPLPSPACTRGHTEVRLLHARSFSGTPPPVTKRTWDRYQVLLSRVGRVQSHSAPWAKVTLGPTIPRPDFLRLFQVLPNSERALPSQRPRSLLRLVLISLHGFVPRGTVFSAAPSVSALRDTSALTPSPSPPAAGGPFQEVRFPPAPPPLPVPGWICGLPPFPLRPQESAEGGPQKLGSESRLGLLQPGKQEEIFRPPSPGAAGLAAGGVRRPRDRPRGLVSPRQRPVGAEAHGGGRGC